MRNTNWRATGLLSTAALLLGSTSISAQAQPLRFGVYATDKPATMKRTFAPVAKALGDRVTALSGRQTDVHLRIFMSYDEGLDALVKGEVDLARFGAASYVLAKHRNPKVGLLAMENKKGARSFEGYIVVHTRSPFQKLEDLRGRSFAFGDENSTIGRYFAQARLLDSGLDARGINRFDFLGRHDKVFRAVQVGEYAAGALKSGTFKKLNRRKQLRIIDRFDVPTKPWVSRAGMDADLHEQLSKALCGLTDKGALKALKIQGFFPSTDKDYAEVRACMLQAKRFQPQPARPGKD